VRLFLYLENGSAGLVGRARPADSEQESLKNRAT
jgi:hypothetical protein